MDQNLHDLHTSAYTELSQQVLQFQFRVFLTTYDKLYKFICPSRARPAFRLDLKLLPPMGTGRVAEMHDMKTRKLLTVMGQRYNVVVRMCVDVRTLQMRSECANLKTVTNPYSLT